ncbi:YibE/F family protein [uncultured Enterococcus sp.]|uniref:YibE/F family protein n=1 Tax=uncultured Enterococcus sp. TaxID=167972 RepID=UPI002AA7FD4A|nr:YibE/F family protein [uncultured Enterococcus sp.]
MSVLLLLGFLLAITTIIVCGTQGIYILLGIFCNISLFFIQLYLFQKGWPIYGVTVIAFSMITMVTLFFVNGLNHKTKAAGISVLLFMLFFTLLVVIAADKLSIHGFSAEEVLGFSELEMSVGVDFRQLSFSVILLSLSGAVIDSSMAVASATFEVFEHHPDITFRMLLQSSVQIVKSILSSTINTLLFAFMGSGLALVIWIIDLGYSFGEIVNSKAFVSELSTAIFSGIGAVAVLPLTSCIAAYLYVKTKAAKQ